MKQRRQLILRRVLASLTLAGFALVFSPAPDRACPSSSAGGENAVMADMGGATCPHTDVGACLVTAACVPLSPACVPSGTVAFSAFLIIVSPASTVPFGDLFRTGPPTPPPNSI